MPDLVIEPLDLARLEAGHIRAHFPLDDWHQEVERHDISHCRGEDRRVREVNNRLRTCRAWASNLAASVKSQLNRG